MDADARQHQAEDAMRMALLAIRSPLNAWHSPAVALAPARVSVPHAALRTCLVLLALLLGLVGGVGCGPSLQEQRIAFDQDFVTKLEAIEGVHAVTLVKEHLYDVQVGGPTGTTLKVDLDFPWAASVGVPKSERAAVVDEWIANVAQAVAAIRDTAVLTPAKILPIIRTRTWVATTQQEAPADSPTKRLLSRPLGGELVVTWAQTGADRLRYLNEADLAPLQLTIPGLDALATENFHANALGYTLESRASLYWVTLDHAPATSLLLHDPLWRHLDYMMIGKPVACAPLDGVLLVADSDDPQGLMMLQDTAKTLWSKGTSQLWQGQLQWDEGTWKAFESPAPDLAAPSARPSDAPPATTP